MSNAMPENVPYTPPAWQGESMPENQAAYDGGHKAGFAYAGLANLVDEFDASAEAASAAAVTWLEGRYEETGGRRYLRAHEGFCDGVADFAAALADIRARGGR